MNRYPSWKYLVIGVSILLGLLWRGQPVLGLTWLPFVGQRFTSLVGESPHAYLTRWRMNLAAKLLRTTSRSAEEIAAQVGYASATAFNGAFRRHLSVSPGRYRRAAPAPVEAVTSSPRPLR